MATNLQVTASTQQAVGAFNSLAASIANASQQFRAMGQVMVNAQGTASRYAGSVTAINSAFNNLISVTSAGLNALRNLGAGAQFVFSSVIKELDKLQGFQAILSVTTKSSDDVSASYDFLRKTADRLGVQFDSLTSNYAKLVAALPPGIEGLKTAEKVFMGTAMAARTLHASNQDTQLMFYALTQMASKGVVSMEELRRQLGEKLPGVIQIAAKGLNTLPETLEAAIRKGIVSSEKFLPAFGDALIRTFADSSEKASTSVSAAIARLTNVWVDFTKNILDSGAGQSIVGIFDALREKLSDPYLIERFSLLIKNLSERFTEFVSSMTADDLRNGFDTATKAIELAVNVIGKLIEGLTWIINNSAKAGAIIGTLAGASVGAMAGPIGMVVGAGVGGSIGTYAGISARPSAAQAQARASGDAAAQVAAEAQANQQQLLKFNALIPMLSQFRALDTLKGLDNLFKAENLNTKTLVDLNKILTGPEFKTDADRAQGVRDYAKSGIVMGPQSSTLESVLQGRGTPKKSAADKALDSSELKAFGLNSNVQRELANYLTLVKDGSLNMNQYATAVQGLIDKQPYMIAYQKELKEAQEAESKATSDHITEILKQVDAKDALASRLDNDLAMTSLRGDALAIERQLITDRNALAETGYRMTEAEVTVLRQKLTLISQLTAMSAAEQSILDATVNRNAGRDQSLSALGNLEAAGSIGKGDAQDYLSQQNPGLFQGTSEAMEIQKRAMADMYQFIEQLRSKDYISEATAVQMKLRVNQEAQAQQLANVGTYFGNLATLQYAGSRKLFEVGKAAALAQAIIDGYAAIQKAYASVPYPMNYAAAATTAVSVFANIQRIRASQPGYMSGGYTGDGSRTSVAGVVHGQEFVANARATALNRSTLEAMNRGAKIESGGGKGITITNAPVINIDSRTDRASIMQDVQAALTTSNAQLVDKLQRARMLDS